MSKSLFKLRYLFLVLLVLIPSVYPQDLPHTDLLLKHLKHAHEKHSDSNIQLIQEKSQTNTKTQTNTTTTEQVQKKKTTTDSNGFFSILFDIFITELGDIAFYAALIISFIYHPVFAIGAFSIASFLNTLLGAVHIARVLVKMPTVVVSFITAILFISFAGLTAYYMYSQKDVDLIIDTAIKGGEHAEAHDEEEETLVTPGPEAKQKPQAPLLSWEGLKRMWDFEFLKMRPFRLLLAAFMLFVCQIAEDTLRAIVTYRKTNGFVKVFLGSLIGFALCAGLIFVIGYVIKEVTFRKFKISLDKTKLTKYVSCGLLMLFGVLKFLVSL